MGDGGGGDGGDVVGGGMVVGSESEVDLVIFPVTLSVVSVEFSPIPAAIDASPSSLIEFMLKSSQRSVVLLASAVPNACAL